jgi:hypothetical protein
VRSAWWRIYGEEMQVKAFWVWTLGLVMVGLPFVGERILGTNSDPYEALKLCDGAWEVKTTTAKKPDHLVNHCSQTGKFFACSSLMARQLRS